MNHGYGSNTWLAKQVILGANPALVKLAVLGLIEELDSDNPEIDVFEVIDRLVQVSTQGTYYTEDEVEDLVRKSVDLADQVLSPSIPEDVIDKLAREFRDELDGMEEGE